LVRFACFRPLDRQCWLTPFLLSWAAPRNERILESSRFCVDARLAAEQAGNGLGRATFILFAAMIEAARTAGADSIVTVTDVRMERILRRAAGRSDGSRRRSRSA
jgi:N-acyl-L-homoserine lactone synthetase